MVLCLSSLTETCVCLCLESEKPASPEVTNPKVSLELISYPSLELYLYFIVLWTVFMGVLNEKEQVSLH